MTLRISVIGTGYLGATHAACMAELGHSVIGVDRDVDKISLLRAGVAPIAEPGLAELLRRHVRSGRLRFTTDITEAAREADVHFVCVGTPQSAGGSAADLGAVHAVVDALASSVRRDCLIVGKSTVPVGTTARIAARIAERVPSWVSARLAWNPEFLREGHGVEDTLRPSRLVLGVADPVAESTLREVYRDLIVAGVPLHVTDFETAELAKAAANAFLATKISFVNAMADLSDRSGADVVALADILGDDPRIGRAFLDAGVGFGGGCLPKDVRALAAVAEKLGAADAVRLLTDVDEANTAARERVVDAAVEMCGGSVCGQRIGVLGAAFKPGSDDVRDSPALYVAHALHLRGAKVRIYDPQANVNARSVRPELRYVASPDAAARNADLLLHVTAWPEFGRLDPAAVAPLVRHRRILDARNSLDAERWRAAGWQVRGVGRGAVGGARVDLDLHAVGGATPVPR